MRIFDLFCFKYNRTDFHELNLDWIISDLRTLAETLENFINLNTIKYANPIQWNITTQYEANTVVVDANDGTAYLSVKPVPTGVAITNTDYWTPIFKLNLLSANQNITLRDDGSNVLATFASNTDDWLIWNATLYKVSQPIAVNEAYVVGYNLNRYSVELFIQDYVDAINTKIGELTDLNTTDKSSIVNAINSLQSIISGLIATPEMFGAVGDGTTDDTDAINAWLNSDYPILTAAKHYLVTDRIIANKTHSIIGNNAIIEVSDLIVPNDIKLIQFNNCDGLYLNGLTFKIVSTTRTPFVNDGQPNSDGMLVHIYNSSDVTIDNCKFIVERGSVEIPCTPLWFTDTCNNIHISNSVFSNTGYAQRSGALWFYGVMDNIFIDNCTLISSTLDELIQTWGVPGVDTYNNLVISNSTFESLARNDQIINVISHVTATFNNCKIEMAENVVNHRTFKTSAYGHLIVQNCEIHYTTISNGSLFGLTSENAHIEAIGNRIYSKTDVTTNPSMLEITAGRFDFKNNIFEDIGDYRTVLFWLREENAEIYASENTFIMPKSGITTYIYGYDIFNFIHNIFVGSEAMSYTYSSLGDLTKNVYSNIYTGTISGIYQNMNESLAAGLRGNSQISANNISGGASADFDLPAISNINKQIGFVMILCQDVSWLNMFGCIYSKNDGTYGFVSLYSNTNDITVSVSGTTLTVTNASNYGGKFMLLTDIFDSNNLSN